MSVEEQVPCPRHTTHTGPHHDYACPLHREPSPLPAYPFPNLALKLPCGVCGGPTRVQVLNGCWDGWCRACNQATTQRVAT